MGLMKLAMPVLNPAGRALVRMILRKPYHSQVVEIPALLARAAVPRENIFLKRYLTTLAKGIPSGQVQAAKDLFKKIVQEGKYSPLERFIRFRMKNNIDGKIVDELVDAEILAVNKLATGELEFTIKYLSEGNSSGVPLKRIIRSNELGEGVASNVVRNTYTGRIASPLMEQVKSSVVDLVNLMTTFRKSGGKGWTAQPHSHEARSDI